MKAVLISIQPKWCELIASGKKTVEVRKTKPKIETPFKCYIYCTAKKPSDNEWQYKPNLYLDKVENKVRWIDVEFTRTYNCEYLQQRVIGEFVCDFIDEYKYDYCPHPEIGMNYDCGDNWWEIDEEDLENACLTEAEFRMYAWRNKIMYGWHISDLVIYDKPKELREFRSYNVSTYIDEEFGLPMPTHEIKRPPQSYMYVEELKGE